MMHDKRILFVGKKYLCKPSGGREMLSALNYQALKRIYKNNFFDFEISSYTALQSKTTIKRKIFHGEIDGISPAVIEKLLEFIHQNKINQLFIDGSNLGLVAQSVKENFPHIKIYTLFHNVEVKFFYDSFLRKKSFRAFAIGIANYFAERKAVLQSNHIICLTDIDSAMLKKVYGKKADSISAIALSDQLPQQVPNTIDSTQERYVLFVGGLFYGNEFGIRWFVKNVASHIACKTYIVGSGFEVLANELEANRNVRVLGRVDDLSDYYFHADYVIAPIFEGSGMKTKVAEAFMFGKKILATDAALAGYDGVPKDSYYACNTQEEFIQILNQPTNQAEHAFDQNLRTIYQQQFSLEAAESRLKRILLK